MTDTHIKINAVTPKVQYTGNGSTVSFPYSFAIFDDSDMVVYVGDNIITTGYTVSGAGQTEGGAVVFDTAPASGTKITLLRSVPIERVTDFQEGGTFRPKNINDEFDRQTAFVQQVQETLDRAVKVSPTSDVDPEEVATQVARIYSSIDNVDAVADDLTNVDSVAGDLTNLDTVAGSISNVDATGQNIANVNTVAGISSNVTTVAGISSAVSNVSSIKDDVTNVSSISSDVTAVNSNKTNINTVAADIADVNSVASNISNVSAVADNETNINAVNSNKTNIDTVATDISNVNAVGSNIAKVVAVADNETNINAVNANKTNIDAVAGNATNITAVAGNATNINAVAGNATNINAVNANKTNIDKVAGDKNRIDLVADDIANVDTVAINISDVIDVAAIDDDITTVASNISDVSAVATDIADVSTTAANIAEIIDAPNYASLAKDWANKTGSTVDGSEYSAKYYAQQAAATLANKIDKGYAVNDFATNCITEIPQDITLTLSSGTLTIKDGSVITLADGTQRTISGDKTYTHSTNGTYFAVTTATGGSLRLSEVSNTCSGSTDALAGVANHTWFDTTNQTITKYGADGTSVDGTRALPVGIVTVSGGAISSIDRVFNGGGYIGSSIFVLPGIKFLAPKGFNTDGTLSSNIITRDALSVVNVNNVNDYSGYGAITHSSADIGAYNGYGYNKDSNKVYKASTEYSGDRGIAIYTKVESHKVSEFHILPVSGLSANYITTALTSVTGYDATKTQTLKHVNGVLTWVTDS